MIKTPIQYILSRILQVKNKLIRYLKSLLITDRYTAWHLIDYVGFIQDVILKDERVLKIFSRLLNSDYTIVGFFILVNTMLNIIVTHNVFQRNCCKNNKI